MPNLSARSSEIGAALNARLNTPSTGNAVPAFMMNGVQIESRQTLSSRLQYTPGQRVMVSAPKDKAQLVEGEYRRPYPKDTSYHYVFIAVDGAPHKEYIRKISRTADGSASSPVIQPCGPEIPRFDVNTRFSLLQDMVKMVATKEATSLIVTGPGGLGKSYTVAETLKSCSLEEGHDFVVIKGYSTAKSLYRTLHEHRERVIVFDDCDSVLTNNVAVQLLKAALDSNPVRQVKWLSEAAGQDNEGGLPSEFNFEGKVIFISNMGIVKIPQALLSRALFVDLEMTADEKIERIRAIAPAMRPDVSMDKKNEVIELLFQYRNVMKDLNCRSFIKILGCRLNSECWKEVSIYLLTTGN